MVHVIWKMLFYLSCKRPWWSLNKLLSFFPPQFQKHPVWSCQSHCWPSWSVHPVSSWTTQQCTLRSSPLSDGKSPSFFCTHWRISACLGYIACSSHLVHNLVLISQFSLFLMCLPRSLNSSTTSTSSPRINILFLLKNTILCKLIYNIMNLNLFDKSKGFADNYIIFL